MLNFEILDQNNPLNIHNISKVLCSIDYSEIMNKTSYNVIYEKITKNTVLNYLPYLSLLHLEFCIYSQRHSSDGMLCVTVASSNYSTKRLYK